MSQDIVERLRLAVREAPNYAHRYRSIMCDAADEIETKIKLIERLRAEAKDKGSK